MSDAAQCRNCGEQVFWADSKNGKAMLLDAEPVSEYAQKSYVLLDRENANPVAVFARIGLYSDEPHYTCHFDTCAAR